jgi:acetyltransferase EpsM
VSATPVLIPLVNPNEPEAQLAAIGVHDKQWVQSGTLLCTLETTKSTMEVYAEADGYIIALQRRPGDTVRAGELLCYLAASADWQPPEDARIGAHSDRQGTSRAEVPPGLRLTRPAQEFAESSGIDLADLPRDRLITVEFLKTILEQPAAAQQNLAAPPEAPFDASAVIIYGGGGHGKAVIELLRAAGIYQIAGVLDDGVPAGSTLLDVPILGGQDQLPGLHARGIRLAINAVGGISNLSARMTVFDRLHAAGFTCPSVAHPTAFIEPSARLEPGVQVFPHAYIGSDASIGFGSIINTAAIVSHDCRIGEYANLSPGATLAGEVEIGAGALVGMRATVNLQVQIGNGARIGNGATVKTDVPAGGIVPAGTIWPKS